MVPGPGDGVTGARTRLGSSLAATPMAAFAFVMATGIVATALDRLQDAPIAGVAAKTLVMVSWAGYVLLAILAVVRLCYRPREVLADLHDPRRAFGAFTFVAASDVLASWSALHGARALAVVMVVVAGVAWVALTYTIPALLVLGRAPRERSDTPLLRAVDGTWFLSIVGTQSVAVALATIERNGAFDMDTFALLGVVMWGLGALGYLIVATIVLVRLLRYPVSPTDLGAPYWIVSGATAITVLAGARLLDMPDTPVLTAVRPTMLGLSVVLWGFGLGIVPLLVGLGHWRHVMMRHPFRYETPVWSIVFPLGMFAVASMELAEAAGLPIIDAIGRVWTWVAMAAWLLFAAMGVLALMRLLHDNERTRARGRRISR